MGLNQMQRILPQSEYHLLLFSLLLVVAALGQFIYSSGSVLSGLLMVLIPLGVSIGLGVFTVRLQQRKFDAEHIHQITAYGWVGTMISAAACGWMIALQYANNLPIEWMTDHIVIILSIGVGAGVFVGKATIQPQQSERSTQPEVSDHQTMLPANRGNLIVETSWMDRPGSEPIMETIVQMLAESEQIDPLDVDPLINYIDTDIFEQLRRSDSSRWDLRFHTDKHIIHVSSLGTVSVYESSSGNGNLRILHSE